MAIETFTVDGPQKYPTSLPCLASLATRFNMGLSGEELSVAWESVEYMWPSVRPLVPVS